MLTHKKIGFRLSGFRRRRLKDALAALAQIGYDGVELCLEHGDINPDSSDRWATSKIRKCLRDNGLQASAVSFHGKRSGWEEKKRKCRAGLEIAAELEVKTFISGSVLGGNPAAFDELRRFTEYMCGEADKLETNFAVEPEPGTVINGSREMSALMKAVKSPRLKINLDIGHSYLTEEDVCDDIMEWGYNIVHLHIEDIKGKIHRHLPPGEGDLDFKSIFSALDSIDYSGFYTLDLFDILDDPEYFARKGIHALRKELQP